MGVIIQYQLFKFKEEYGSMKTIVYCDGKYCAGMNLVSLNEELARILINIKPERRTLRIEKIFNQLIASVSDNSCIRDFDVLFNPDYAIDALQILASAGRTKKISVLWPGTIEDGKLIYAEDGYDDYKKYDVKQYDIICIV